MGHNEPVEHAQKSTGVVTASALLAIVRQGTDSISLHGRAAHDRASYSDAFVFEVRATSRESFSSKVKTTSEIEVPGYVSNGYTSEREERQSTDPSFGAYMKYTESFRPLSGFWYLPCGREPLTDILELLPRDAEVSLHVYLDAGTHESLTRANATDRYGTQEGFHCDHLYLEASYMVRGKRKTRRFLVATSVGPHNTARFGVR